MDSFWGRGCRAGRHLRCRLTFIWSCVWAVWVSVRRSFGFVLGGKRCFFHVMMQKFDFVFAAVLLRKVDLVMLSMQKMKFMA